MLMATMSLSVSTMSHCAMQCEPAGQTHGILPLTLYNNFNNYNYLWSAFQHPSFTTNIFFVKIR